MPVGDNNIIKIIVDVDTILVDLLFVGIIQKFA